MSINRGNSLLNLHHFRFHEEGYQIIKQDRKILKHGQKEKQHNKFKFVKIQFEINGQGKDVI